ncbi:MAG: hypothetical protein IVW51_17995 [Thermaceae bacterium]|nr:hypothetical protein [Thermaceae bacterium]
MKTIAYQGRFHRLTDQAAELLIQREPSARYASKMAWKQQKRLELEAETPQDEAGKKRRRRLVALEMAREGL